MKNIVARHLVFVYIFTPVATIVNETKYKIVFVFYIGKLPIAYKNKYALLNYTELN